jgi:hypothetical protein
MKTIFVDYNAITESDQLRLSFPASREDLHKAGVRPGDWAWLSDGEVIVGAQILVDPDYGLVGKPAWDTLIHVDEDDGRGFTATWSDLQRLLHSRTRSADDETRLLELLAQLEEVAPPEIQAVVPPQSQNPLEPHPRLQRRKSYWTDPASRAIMENWMVACTERRRTLRFWAEWQIIRASIDPVTGRCW